MKLLIKGVVQGVGFRPTVVRVARSLALKGYVQNKGSHVEVYLESGEEEFIERLREELPPLARIDEIVQVKEEAAHTYEGFVIVGSEDGLRSSIIPPDTAICDNCLKELFDPSDRRHLFPFINCTNCGARFTAIYALPYDRKNTSMGDFPMCDECLREYTDEENRRFHAQTTSCPDCGPHYTLYGSNAEELPVDDPIKEYAMLMDDGKIGVMKSWGGMHISAPLEEIDRLRKWYGRPEKPFAIMVRDIETAMKYAYISEEERKMLLSPQRPIVLLDKKDVPESVSPGLPNVGIYLPYAAAHHILFRHMRSDALIMTSANLPGEPMLIENEDAFGLGADAYLLHNRPIANRADDSLLRMYRGRRQFIRRSRGFVPEAFPVDYDGVFIGVGAEMNLAFTVSKGGKVYGSQYIGNVSRLGNYEYMEEMMERFLRWLGIENVDGIAMDLHPGYASRRLARRLGERFDVEPVEIQHHHAHAAALAGENGREGILALTLDGTGYGTDGNSWGGEVILSRGRDFERKGHLQEIPLIGGDKAVIEPLRLVFAWQERLGIDGNIFDERKEDVLRKVSRNSIKTSSFGRFMDALSAYLGVCTYRSYDGEPAMKLERYLEEGKDLGYPVEIRNGTVMLEPIFEEVFSAGMSGGKKKADVAHSAVRAAIKGLVSIAAEEAEKEGMEDVGVSGGVSYNRPLLEMIRKELESQGMSMLVHEFIPNGDGGVSYGQNFILSKY